MKAKGFIILKHPRFLARNRLKFQKSVADLASEDANNSNKFFGGMYVEKIPS